MASLSCTGALAVSIDMLINIQQAQPYSRQAQETQNVAGVGSAQCQQLLNKVKHISIIMAAKGQSNDLSTDALGEAVLVDKDKLSSQELEEIDEESVDGESEEDVVSEKIELCLQAFDLLDLHDANLELYKKCV